MFHKTATKIDVVVSLASRTIKILSIQELDHSVLDTCQEYGLSQWTFTSGRANIRA